MPRMSLRAAESPANKVVLAAVGVRTGEPGTSGRGIELMKQFTELPGVEYKYVIDVDRRSLGPAAALTEKTQGFAPKQETDFRRVLEDKDVDGMLVTTPDHWHAPMAILAAKASKWLLLLCEHGKKYRGGILESDHWDRGFTRLAGPVDMDSTGTMIQKFGKKRYALFDSADQKIYIRSYPDLRPAGELKVDPPPWNADHGSRIWPNVIPLPEGYPAPYIALMMDQ